MRNEIEGRRKKIEGVSEIENEEKDSNVIYFHFDERLQFHGGFNELFDIGILHYPLYQNAVKTNVYRYLPSVI